jgi:hypothetical protein
MNDGQLLGLTTVTPYDRYERKTAVEAWGACGEWELIIAEAGAKHRWVTLRCTHPTGDAAAPRIPGQVPLFRAAFLQGVCGFDVLGLDVINNPVEICRGQFPPFDDNSAG